MNESEEIPSPRAVFVTTLAITLFCIALTAIIASVVPRANMIPRWLELWIAFGWITGWYLSLSMLALRPLAGLLLTQRAKTCFDAAHGFQVPFVIGGVGTWAVVKALGFL